MAGEMIRQGDTTSHNGTALEGSMQDFCHGKPIAYIGHKVYCPKCKGDYLIVEGALTTTFYGKGVALAGMKTSCGATLIPSQFTDTVEYGQKGQSSSASATTNAAPTATALPGAAANKAARSKGPAQSRSEETSENSEKFDLFNVDDVDGGGNSVHINTTPRSGMNLQLKEIGKYIGGAADKPHWSTDGH